MHQERKVTSTHDNEASVNHKLFYKKIKSYCKNKRVLDIGCWTGQLIECMKSDAKEVVGIDPSIFAINFAKKRFYGQKNVKLHKSSIEDLPIEKKKFDVVIMSEVIEHLPKNTEQKVVEKVYKLLNNGGIFIISTPSNNLFSIMLDPAYFLISHRHYSENHLRAFFHTTDFEVLKVEYFKGFICLFTAIAELLLKHIFKRKLYRPQWLNNLISVEFEKGFASIMLVVQKTS